MDYYYIIVAGISVGILILTLTYIGIGMATFNRKVTAFPPVQNKCPDYWRLRSDVSGTFCIIPAKGSSNLGNLNPANLSSVNTPGFQPDNTINFSDDGWYLRGVNSICTQRNWANQYNIVWDGVTNYNDC
uniref:CPW-WPC domain-containing protein n=1 Tax=viral metagenome TaxID=1070528 RepID=A0A6C0I3E1_9ZZZZ